MTYIKAGFGFDVGRISPASQLTHKSSLRQVNMQSRVT